MATPTSLAVVVDLEEYSRFESDKDTITATVTPGGTGLFGEQVTVTLRQARRNRDVAVATETVTLADDNPFTVTFSLPDIVDEENCPKVRRGKYFVHSVSIGDPGIEGESSDFLVSLISVERLKADYLHGTDSLASDVLGVAEQPVIVTGVTVTDVSKGHPMKFFPLSYSYSDDGGGTITRMLQWCSGPGVVVTSTKTTYVLRRSPEASDYIKVRIVFGDLPSDSVTEQLLIQQKPLADERIRQILDQAISWVEDTELHIYLEPTKIVTEVDPGTIAYSATVDYPTLVESDYDKKVDAVSYYRPSAGHWINVKFPYYPLQKFEELYGKVSNTRILDVQLEWVEIHTRGGFFELVPFNQEIAFNFIGLVWVESLRGPVPIPNFWNFTAIVGFCVTPPVLLELVAKKAAIDILTIAGQAFRAGVSSQSVSRDGVSESVSYTSSAIYGVYSATINEYKDFIKQNVKKLRGSFKGANMQVL